MKSDEKIYISPNCAKSIKCLKIPFEKFSPLIFRKIPTKILACHLFYLLPSVLLPIAIQLSVEAKSFNII